MISAVIRLVLTAVLLLPALAFASQDAMAWLQRLQQALQQKHFIATFVLVKNNRAEPYRWLHGRFEDTVVEQLLPLNGPVRAIVRQNDKVAFFDNSNSPYALHSRVIGHPLPPLFFQDLASLQESYRFVLVGKSRIAGRVAQLVRVVPVDPHRYGIWLWLDSDSGLVLKVATVSKEGEVLEQLQFTSLQVLAEPTAEMGELARLTLPPAMEAPPQVASSPHGWQVGWLPEGMRLLRADRHALALSGQAVDYLLLSDGLVEVSVYLHARKEPVAAQLVQNGATTLLLDYRQGVEISVVGNIPPQTARQIARSVHRAR